MSIHKPRNHETLADGSVGAEHGTWHTSFDNMVKVDLLCAGLLAEATAAFFEKKAIA
jgi:hypothetical protein